MKNLIRKIFSRPVFQSIFESLLNFSLKALNIGEGQSVETSGEKVVFKILNKIANEKVVVFDVGAHTGEWYNLFKENYTKDSVVYSFEPSKESYLKLLEIKDFNFHPENLALGDKTGETFLFSPGNAGSPGSYISDEGMSANKENSDKVTITTINKYCHDNNIKNIDLLKLDVEGYEIKILKGAKEMLKNDVIKMIQFEFGAPSPEKYSLKDFFDLLTDKYDIYRILSDGYYPVKEWRHYYEIMTVTNFVAIKKDFANKL